MSGIAYAVNPTNWLESDAGADPTYKTRKCKSMVNGKCPFGKKCQFAHTAEECARGLRRLHALTGQKRTMPKFADTAAQENPGDKLRQHFFVPNSVSPLPQVTGSFDDLRRHFSAPDSTSPFPL